jgi:hypothetical protein
MKETRPSVEVAAYAIQNNPVTTQEIANNTSASESTVYRVLNDFVERSVFAKDDDSTPAKYMMEARNPSNEPNLPSVFRGCKLVRTGEREYMYVIDFLNPKFNNIKFRVRNTGVVEVVDRSGGYVENRHKSISAFLKSFEEAIEKDDGITEGNWKNVYENLPGRLGQRFVSVPDDYMRRDRRGEVVAYEFDGESWFNPFIELVKRGENSYEIDLCVEARSGMSTEASRTYPQDNSTLSIEQIPSAIKSLADCLEPWLNKRDEEIVRSDFEIEEVSNYRHYQLHHQLLQPIDELNIRFEADSAVFECDRTYTKLIYNEILDLDIENDFSVVNGWSSTLHSLYMYPLCDWEDNGTITCSVSSSQDEREIKIVVDIMSQVVSCEFPNDERHSEPLEEISVVIDRVEQYMCENSGIDGEENLEEFPGVGSTTVEKMADKIGVETDLELFQKIKADPDAVRDVYRGDVDELQQEVEEKLESKGASI